MLIKKLVFIVSFFVLASCGEETIAYLNSIETTRFKVDGSTLYMDGEINSKSLGQFREIMREHPEIETLVERNVPGSIDDDSMILLAYEVRKAGLNTRLLGNSEVYSGGVDLFLAGVKRTIERGAIIGVHSWTDGTKEATDFPRGHPEHEKNRKYIEDMLGDDAFYWFTIEAAPARDIHIMTVEEIAKFGLETENLHTPKK